MLAASELSIFVPFITSLLSIAAKRGVLGGQDIARAVWIWLGWGPSNSYYTS
jgi:hypothetical protein